MTDKDIVQKVASLFGYKVVALKAKRKKWKPSFRVQIRGSKAAKLMRCLSPLMGCRRQEQIRKALAAYFPKLPYSLSEEQLEQIAVLRTEGLSYSQIGERVGCNRSTVGKRLKKMGM